MSNNLIPVKNVMADELVINWHITEACNYRCKFCYSQWNNTCELHRQQGEVERLIEQLAGYFIHSDNPLRQKMGYSSVRLNFAGGEPLLLKERAVNAIHAAHRAGFKLSVITNGHFLNEQFIEQAGSMLDMVGISFDSQDSAGQANIGRVDRHGQGISARDLIARVEMLRKQRPDIAVKINTVVNGVNWQEDFNQLISQINPCRWKVLQVLPVLDRVDLSVNAGQFQAFVERHNALTVPVVVEDNQCMAGSYLMIDPAGRFYQNAFQRIGYDYSHPILQVGVEQALSQITFAPEHFAARYGDLAA